MLHLLSFQWLPDGELVALLPCVGVQPESVFNRRRRTAMKQTATLEIVWRNPKPPLRQQRWEQIKQDSEAAHYVVQELVSTSAGSFWTAMSSLEIIAGGRAA
jgi:hypothetical protein